MKKNALVVLVCLFMGLSASAALPKPKVSKEKKEFVKVTPLEVGPCASFSWTPSCQSSPMTSSVCVDSSPLNSSGLFPLYMLYLMFTTWAELEGSICPSSPAGPLDHLQN